MFEDRILAAMEAEALDQFLRQGLIDKLQQALEGDSDLIGCEHSSGLDSNAVLEARKIDEENNRISSRAERAAFLTKVFQDDSLIIGARL